MPISTLDQWLAQLLTEKFGQSRRSSHSAASVSPWIGIHVYPPVRKWEIPCKRRFLAGKIIFLRGKFWCALGVPVTGSLDLTVRHDTCQVVGIA